MLFAIITGVVSAINGFISQLFSTFRLKMENEWVSLCLSILIILSLFLICEAFRVFFMLKALKRMSSGKTTILCFLGNVCFTLIVESYYNGKFYRNRTIGILLIAIGIFIISD